MTFMLDTNSGDTIEVEPRSDGKLELAIRDGDYAPAIILTPEEALLVAEALVLSVLRDTLPVDNLSCGGSGSCCQGPCKARW
ncbi:hypothetical protein UFOVP730_45 [uncultured Caudovirales phage]|uniref:Uncharacterized protein n=1 Tax=uncultured Caudovirales phage TaxID=2100421 RepID=A0A6J5NRI0_9CAUD|nr:hypothetical protein UFOVP730_45 [uncultured Caudovirales phage]